MAGVMWAMFRIFLKVGFWSAVIWTFLPIVTILLSSILFALNGSVLADLFYMVQMWLPFNFNVLLTWSLALATAFGLYWIAKWADAQFSKLMPAQF